jgi:hypothetical protein
MKPPEMQINPYTKQRMQVQAVQYPENQITLAKVKSFIFANLPNYATTIDSSQKLTQFLNNPND